MSCDYTNPLIIEINMEPLFTVQNLRVIGQNQSHDFILRVDIVKTVLLFQ